MVPRDYKAVAQKLTKPLSEQEQEIEMMAMFLCDSHIVILGPSGDGTRLSGGHGWHRTRSEEQAKYREQAKKAIAALTVRHIP